MITEVKIIRFSETPGKVRYRLYVGDEFQQGYATESEALVAAKEVEEAIAANYPKSEIVYQSKIEHL